MNNKNELKLINDYIIKNGLNKYIDNWNEQKNNNLPLDKKLINFHKHSFIEETNLLSSTINKLPRFFWDKKLKIGRIRFYQFLNHKDIKQTITDENNLILNVNQKLISWLKKDIQGLIIDLSCHKGGSFFPFIQSLKLILGSTTLFAWSKNKVNKNENLWFNIDDNLKLLNNSLFKTNKINFKKPIAIIISSRTASAGEFCGVIFKGRENCKFFGENSKGLLSVNSSFKLNDNKNLLIPTKLVTSVEDKFYNNEYLDVDKISKSPIKDAKFWLKETLKN